MNKKESKSTSGGSKLRMAASRSRMYGFKELRLETSGSWSTCTLYEYVCDLFLRSDRLE